MSYIFRILVCAFILLKPLSSVFAGTEENMMQSVLKIKTYERETIGGNYSFSQWGSAVIIDSRHIITNAHVILDSEGAKPTWFYELCKSIAWKKDPVCFTTAKLISYDTVTDIAFLELATPISEANKLSFSDKKLSIGTSIVVYGYPEIGGSNITRTEGKIWWTEGDNYKFDGTIDYWNSGGGAFDKDWRLVGIPFAVRSDNWMIGYIIPSSIVQDFLDGDTYNIEKYKSQDIKEFTTFVKTLQLVSKNPNLIKTKKVEIKNMAKFGFFLKSAVHSRDGSAFDYRFLDKNERVGIVVICTKDASKKKTSIDLVEEAFGYKDQSMSYVNTGRYLDAGRNFYFSSSVAAKEKNGEKVTLGLLLSKKALECGVYIIANDGQKKDKVLYEKAIEIAKTINFMNPRKIWPDYISSFFTVKDIPDNVYIGEGSSFPSTRIVPHIFISLSPEYATSSQFDIYTYDSVEDYMNIGYYGDDDLYRGTDKSFQAFFDRYKTVGDTKITDTVVTSKNGKKFVLSTVDKTNSDMTPIQEKTRLVILYPFKTLEWEYKAYQFSFEYASKNSNFLNIIRNFMETIEFPGNSPFN